MTSEREIPRTWTIDQIRESDPESRLPLLGSGMLMSGGYSILGGPPGVGKTFVSMKLADCIASNSDFGTLPTRTGHVLYLSEEMSRVQLKLRSDIFAWRHREGVEFVFRPQLALDKRDGMSFLYRIIDQHPADLVVIDHLRASHSLPETNDDLGPILRGIIEVAERTSSAVLVLHHLRKAIPGVPGGADDLRGGGILRAEASEVFLCTQGNQARQFSFNKARYQEEPPTMNFEIGWNDGRIDVIWQN